MIISQILHVKSNLYISILKNTTIVLVHQKSEGNTLIFKCFSLSPIDERDISFIDTLSTSIRDSLQLSWSQIH